MSNPDTIIPERAADIENFMGGRLLPFRKKRTVGSFAFIDRRSQFPDASFVF